MIDLKLTGLGYDLTEKISEYVQKKLGSLDRFLPRNAKAASGTVTLELDPSGREDNQCVCEAIVTAPGAVFQAKEATLNMFAAVDIVEAKLKSQIHKYKEKQHPKRGSKDLAVKLLSREGEEEPEPSL